MTRDEARHAAEVMIAFAEGKEIESKDRNSKGWNCYLENPTFDWRHWDYRVKPEQQTPSKEDMVNHPQHYEWLKDLCGVEPIDICRHFDFAVGNALKYLLRKGKKDGSMTDREKRIQDLQKAVFYINDEIKRLKQNDNDKDNKRPASLEPWWP